MVGGLAFFTMAALFAIIVVGSNISIWRHNKKRQQLEAKTPYDHLLKHLEEENGRLLKEANTIKAIRRLETLNESLRNEIETNTPEYEEEPSQDVYGGEEAYLRSCALTDELFIRMLDRQNKDDENRHIDGRVTLERERSNAAIISGYGMSTEEAAWDAGAVARAYAGNVREVEHVVTSGETLATIARNYGVRVWDIVENNDLLKYANLKNHGIVCGQTLKIRVGQELRIY